MTMIYSLGPKAPQAFVRGTQESSCAEVTSLANVSIGHTVSEDNCWKENIIPAAVGAAFRRCGACLDGSQTCAGQGERGASHHHWILTITIGTPQGTVLVTLMFTGLEMRVN